MARILVGTDDGLRELALDREPGAVRHPGRRVTAVAREGWELWAILDRREVWHTAGMDWWFHVGDLDALHGNCLADTRAGVVVGTSEARLFRVAGEGLEPVEGFDRVAGRSEWYTPWGGPPDTRSISEDDNVVYANVHVGGIVRSADQGKSWEPTIDIHADVHKVWATSDRVFAACARGLAVSEDRGDTWETRADGLHAEYCRGVAICGETVLVSASDGPGGGHGAVYRGRVDGGPLERCREGLPEWFDGNIDSSWLDATEGLAAFATADARVFASTSEGAGWTEIASELPPIQALLTLA